MKTLWNYSNWNNDLRLTRKDANICYHSGDCQQGIEEVINKPYVKKQLLKLDATTLKTELNEYGTWDADELESHKDNLMRWVWISACDILDNN